MSDYVHRVGTTWGEREPWPTSPFAALRSWESYTEWWNLEPSRGLYAWNNLDWLVSQAELHHVSLLYTFSMTPRWASSQPNNSTCHLANQGAYGSCAPPANIQDWDNFVTALATRYAGRIKSYELWNEPNLPAFWVGTTAQMLTMAQHAYKIIKSIDSTATVLTPAVAGGYGATWMGGYLALGGGNYADVLAFHGYQSTKDGEPRQAELIVSYVDLYRQQMAKYGQSAKPLWDTEFSWEYSYLLTNLNAQAAFLAKAYVLRASKGIARGYWFAWDTPYWGGLWNSTTGATPAAHAYGEVFKWLVGASWYRRCTPDANATWHCVLTRPGGYQAEIVWNSSKILSYWPPSQYRYARQLNGNIFALGTTTISVGTQPQLLETSNAF